MTSFATASPRLALTFKTRQGPAVHRPGPPSGPIGDTFESSLVLRNAGIAQLGGASHARIGSMDLSYTLRKQCTAFASTCVATADFATVTTLPGGSVLAGGRSISIAAPTIRIPVTGGTGRFAEQPGEAVVRPQGKEVEADEAAGDERQFGEAARGFLHAGAFEHQDGIAGVHGEPGMTDDAFLVQVPGGGSLEAQQLRSQLRRGFGGAGNGTFEGQDLHLDAMVAPRRGRGQEVQLCLD